MSMSITTISKGCKWEKRKCSCLNRRCISSSYNLKKKKRGKVVLLCKHGEKGNCSDFTFYWYSCIYYTRQVRVMRAKIGVKVFWKSLDMHSCFYALLLKKNKITR